VPPSLQGTPAVCKFVSLAHQLPAHVKAIFTFFHAAVVLKLLLAFISMMCIPSLASIAVPSSFTCKLFILAVIQLNLVSICNAI